MTRFALLLLVLCAPTSAAQSTDPERIPPAPDCIDAHALRDLHQTDERTLAMRAGDGTRAVVTLGVDCPAIASGSEVTTLGYGGWLCGAPGETIHAGSQSCPVAGVRVVDNREYADVLRQAHLDAINTLDPVTVNAPRQHRFAGTTDYCLRVDILRGWQEDAGGLRVEVSPKRAGGNRYYRIETQGGCGDVLNAENLRLVSGMGLGMVCGNPGDRVVFSRDQPPAVGNDRGFSRARMQSSLATQYGCRINRLYPIND